MIYASNKNNFNSRSSARPHFAQALAVAIAIAGSVSGVSFAQDGYSPTINVNGTTPPAGVGTTTNGGINNPNPNTVPMPRARGQQRVGTPRTGVNPAVNQTNQTRTTRPAGSTQMPDATRPQNPATVTGTGVGTALGNGSGVSTSTSTGTGTGTSVGTGVGTAAGTATGTATGSGTSMGGMGGAGGATGGVGAGTGGAGGGAGGAGR
ncbi:MAG: hypothetical protein EOP04_18340 [Proteobacteria bacterium]|nr:MAG: hypothetical protein EOP04_18340 [Pseudomonadota bacterium]